VTRVVVGNGPLDPGEVRRRIERLEDFENDMRKWQLRIERLIGGVMVVSFLLSIAAGAVTAAVMNWVKR
jgi:hypothetical protein